MKIGVFDSGVGGITVLEELQKTLPDVDFVYVGDTAHVPYGTRSPGQIEKLSVQCAEILKDKNVDAMVVACNTASSLALGAIQQTMGTTPVFGMVEPGILAALQALALIQDDRFSAPILVLATKATVRSGSYGKTLREKLEISLVPGRLPIPIFEQACPLLVPMIEEGWIDHPILHQTLQEYVQPYVAQKNPGIALLGCTHYPWIHAAFEKALPGWTVVNSAWAIAKMLEETPLVRQRSRPEGKSKSHIEWIFTDREAVPEFAKKLVH